MPSTLNNWGLGCPSTPETMWETMDVSTMPQERVTWENHVARQLGVVPTSTCALYLIADTDWYPLGSHISTAESSAVRLPQFCACCTGEALLPPEGLDSDPIMEGAGKMSS